MRSAHPPLLTFAITPPLGHVAPHPPHIACLTTLPSLIVPPSPLLITDPPQPPSLPPAATSASALPPSVYLDPTTQTAFPSHLASPAAPLQLVGTGVRTVSFLAVRVYSAGFYLAEGALASPLLKGFAPERLVSPAPGDEGLVGEELMGALLEETSAGVVIGELPPQIRPRQDGCVCGWLGGEASCD